MYSTDTTSTLHRYYIYTSQKLHLHFNTTFWCPIACKNLYSFRVNYPALHTVMVSQCRGGPAGFGVGLLTLAVRLSYPHPSPDPPWAWQNGSPDEHSALWAAFYRRQGQELRPYELVTSWSGWGRRSWGGGGEWKEGCGGGSSLSSMQREW